MIKLGLLVLAILVISNTSFMKTVLSGMFNSYEFRTQNKEFTFILISEKGKNIEMMDRHFKIFKNENPQTKDTIIYRTFKKETLKFWNWYSYLTEERYQYPLLIE